MDDAAQDGGIAKASAALEGAADGLADGIDREGLDASLPHLAGEGAGIARRGARSERLRARLEAVDEKVSRVIDRTRGKARAVAETARRARTVPPAVAKDLGAAAKSYATGLGGLVGFYAAAGVVGTAAVIVLTVGLVQGLDRVWGEPWGAFAVALGYGLIAVLLVGAAKGRMAAGRRQARERVEIAKSELRHVTEPLRRAFRRQPPDVPIPQDAAPRGPSTTTFSDDPRM